jgi:hypothetical protein
MTANYNKFLDALPLKFWELEILKNGHHVIEWMGLNFDVFPGFQQI